MDYKEIIKSSLSKDQVFGIVKYLIIKDHSAGLIHSELKKLFPNNPPSESTVRRWCSSLKKGEDISKDARTSNRENPAEKARRIEAIKNCFDQSRHWSLRSLASVTGIPYTSVQRIVAEELGMSKLLAKWVPHKLTDHQKEIRVICARSNRRLAGQTPSLLRRTITIDETWVSLYMAPDRGQARQWVYRGEEPDPVVAQNIHGDKRMLIVGMDYNGIAHWKLLQPKTTVTGEIYKQFLVEFLEKWLGARDSAYVWLLHDNARPHKAQVVKEFIEAKGITVWDHPPYSPDISPLDFNCFGQLKRQLKGTPHTDWDQFEANLSSAISDLNGRGLMNGVQKLTERWARVVQAEGAYI